MENERFFAFFSRGDLIIILHAFILQSTAKNVLKSAYPSYFFSFDHLYRFATSWLHSHSKKMKLK